MNCTMLKLFIKLSVQSSPILMNPSYSFKNKLLFNQIEITHSVSSFYQALSINLPKLNVKSSSFSKFLDTSFRIDSEVIQHYGIKIEGENTLDTNDNLNFKSCFFLNASIILSGKCNLHLDSCFLLGGIYEKYLIDLPENLVITHCTFQENIELIRNLQTMNLNHTSFYLSEMTYTNRYKVIIDSANIISFHTNLTNCKSENGISSWEFNFNYLVAVNNQISNRLIELQRYDSRIDNSILYNNNCSYAFYFGEDSDLVLENSCIFVKEVSNLFYHGFFTSNTINLLGCYLNHTPDEISNEYSVEDDYIVKFDNIYNSNECPLFNQDDISQKIHKFNYKIIGDIEEEFEYELY